MSDSYWTRALTTRVSRRRAIAVSGAGAAGAALLAACGGGSSKSSSGGSGAAQGSALLMSTVDTSKTGKHGGVWKGYLVKDPQNFDLYNFDPFSQPFANAVGSKLVVQKPGHLEDPALAVQGDVASSWEVSPDKLTVTFKLNPQAKWAPLSPTFHSGAPSSIANRVMDANDFLYGWKRFIETPTSSGRDELANSVKPTAPVTSVTAPDKSTVVMKLNKPFAPLLLTLGFGSVSYPYFEPPEADGKVDFFKMQFGGGPYYIDRYDTSIGMTLKRNPNYELKDPDYKRPYADSVELPIIPDPNAAIAQFRTGNVYLGYAGGVPQALAGRPVDEILQLKKDLPALQLLAFAYADPTLMWFGQAKDGPWKDVRVRQAMSLAWDRTTHTSVVFSTDKLEAAGIPANIKWNSAINGTENGLNASFKGWYLNPQGKDFGDNAKYFTTGNRQNDITQAKAMLSAAGFPNGIEFTHLIYKIVPIQQQSMDVMEGIIRDAGFKSLQQVEKKIPEIFNYINGGGNFKELLCSTDFGGPDPGSYYRIWFHPTGSLFGGFNPDSTGVSKDGDPMLNDLVEKILGEFDEPKRIGYSNDLQRYNAKMNYKARYPGTATTLAPSWPVLQNVNVWRGYGLSGAFSYEWIDDTKPPLGKS